MASISLKATSDAGLPVHYHAREGPAIICGSTFIFTLITMGVVTRWLPPRWNYPGGLVR